MRIAFYAPLKPVDHPVPSGDRQLGQALLKALRLAGHDAFVASHVRSFEGRGDARRQARLAELGRRLADRLVRHFSRSETRPELWFTYHLYHKAPDFLGPAVSRALDIPYVVAEASLAAKQRHGKWALGYWESMTAIERASATIFFNPADFAGVRTVRGPPRDDEYVPPFLDLAAFSAPSPMSVAGAAAATHPSADPVDRRKGLRLITVAMMRPGAKLASYRLLADALMLVLSGDWELVLIGDGAARGDVEAAFARFEPSQIRFVGFQNPEAIAAWLRSADLYVWPAIDEAFGMAFIEAQACGLPVIAGDGRGVASVVAADRTGLLVPLGDAALFAHAVRTLMADEGRRRRMAADARNYATSQHDLPAAAARIDAVLRRVAAEHASPARAKPSPVVAR
jgi:glycosyltransferase involved in cell wall biosynthesis